MTGRTPTQQSLLLLSSATRGTDPEQSSSCGDRRRECRSPAAGKGTEAQGRPVVPSEAGCPHWLSMLRFYALG